MSEPKRHHYIPVFYLMQWTQGDPKRLVEYSRPYKSVKAQRKHPSGTGYVEGLYTIPGVPSDQEQFVEREFMKATDDWAAKAQQVLLQPDPKTRGLQTKEQVGWARFVFSLMLRNPEQIKRFEQQAIEREYPGPVQELLPEFINSVRVISVLVQQMTFHTLELPGTKHKLLTSDRPLIMTDGFALPDAHVVMPLSPTRLFIAVRERRIVEQIAGMDKNELVVAVNNKVAEQAQRFVYGVDDSQLRFVENRLGKRVPSTPLG